MGFTIPNEADAAHPEQSDWDKVDLDILLDGVRGNLVVSGGLVTENSGSPNNTIDVASGVIAVNGVQVPFSSAGPTVTANSSGNPRFDLVAVDDTGTVSIVAGTPTASDPPFPDIPADSVILASIFVASGFSSITDDEIIDKRVLAPYYIPNYDPTTVTPEQLYNIMIAQGKATDGS